uniref:Odorant receptor n=1 Tax=Lobesia botrana TaxID=209534 RepID=A0A345BEZ1_9NEOP|nr:odorant receptors OR79 [Lobesia botrana]
MKSINLYRHVSLHLKCFHFTGLWFFIDYPISSIQFWLHILIRFLNALFVFTLPTLGQIFYVKKLFAAEIFAIQEVASCINIILAEVLVSFKALDMFIRRNTFIQLLEQLNNHEFQQIAHKDIIESAIKRSRRYFWVIMIAAFLNVIAHNVVVPAAEGFRNLPAKMDLVFVDIDDPAYFDIICFFQLIYKPTMVLVYVGLQSMPWSMLTFVMAQLDILIDNFENMEKLMIQTKEKKGCSEAEAFKEVFNSLVTHHQAIIRFIDTANATFGGQFALYLMLSSGVICTTGVHFLAIENSSSKDFLGVIWLLAYLSTFIFIQFVDCSFGSSVYVKSTDLATVAYSSPWLKMPKEMRKQVLIVIARAQRPLEISAFNLVPISLQTFTTVMNWTYKAFAIMNGMQ